MRYVATGETWDEAQADEVFDRALSHWREHGFGWRSAVEKATGDWLGFVGLNHPGPEVVEIAADDVEIGWWLRREAWHRGFATEGAVALRDEGFGRIGLERIVARVQPGNHVSRRVATNIGMRVKHAAVGRHGERIVIYSLRRG